MRTSLYRPLVFLWLFGFVYSGSGYAASNAGIQDLPHLSRLLFHHFECTMQIVLEGSEGSKESKFTVLPRGGENSQADAVLQHGSDELKVGANAQMIEMQWSRGGRPVALSEMMVQRSTTPAFVLISLDPTNANNQASVNCVAVTYAEMKNLNASRKDRR